MRALNNIITRLRGESPQRIRALRLRFVERTLRREGLTRSTSERIAREIIEGLDHV